MDIQELQCSWIAKISVLGIGAIQQDCAAYFWEVGWEV